MARHPRGRPPIPKCRVFSSGVVICVAVIGNNAAFVWSEGGGRGFAFLNPFVVIVVSLYSNSVVAEWWNLIDSTSSSPTRNRPTLLARRSRERWAFVEHSELFQRLKSSLKKLNTKIHVWFLVGEKFLGVIEVAYFLAEGYIEIAPSFLFFHKYLHWPF